jgi:hypothetical protein
MVGSLQKELVIKLAYLNFLWLGSRLIGGILKEKCRTKYHIEEESPSSG